LTALKKEYKKSQVNIREYWIETWAKKPSVGDPVNFDTNWKKQKSKPPPMISIPKSTTPINATTSSSTPVGTPQNNSSTPTSVNSTTGSTPTNTKKVF
jgi:hypothetical protein